MRMASREEIIEALEQWIRDLDDIDEGTAILVEGKKDVQSLRSIGIESDIREMNIGQSMLDLLEHLKRGSGPFDGRPGIRRVIILTDWDNKGEKLASMLGHYCKSVDLEFDLEYRRRIALITGRWIRDVESIDSIYSNLKFGTLKL